MTLDPLARNAAALGGLLGLTVLLGPARLRWPWLGPALALLALGTAAGLGALAPGAPLAPFPVEAALTLAGWFLLGSAARAAGGPRLPRHPGYAALLAGILMGDLAAAAWILPAVRDRALGARLAMVAAAGGLMSPIGTPARLLLSGLPELGWMPALLVLLVFPLGSASAPELPRGRLAVSAVLLAVMGVAFTPEWRLPAVVGGAVLLGLMAPAGSRRALPGRELLWLASLVVVVGAARSAGALAELRAALTLGLGLEPAAVAVACAGLGLGVGLLAGEAAGALVLLGLIEAGAGQAALALVPTLALGVAVGEGGLWRGGEGLRAQRGLRALQALALLVWAALAV